MNTRIYRFTLLFVLAGLASGAVRREERPTRLEGSIHYRGGIWPLRVELGATDDELVVLSFPALGVSGLDTSAQVEGDVLTLEIPYGIGVQRLSWVDGAYRTEARPDSSNALAVVLEADKSPAPHRTLLTFTSGEVQIAGTLWTPAVPAEGRFPLVVVGHGAQKFSRSKPEYRFWAEHLTRHGFAAFLYDKRGVGQSGGSYAEADLSQLADDLVAAVRAASFHERVDAERLALLGGSQFGWLAFRAARTLDVDALVLRAAPSVDPITLEVRVLFDQLRRCELTAEELADAQAYVRLYFAAARHPDLFEALISVAKRARGTSWIEHVPVPAAPSDFAWWDRNASFDPTPDIRAYAGPVFVAFGRNDQIASPEINALPYEHLLPASGESLTLWLADEADHRLEVPSRMIDEKLRFPQLAPGYLDRVDAFLEKHLKTSER